MKVEGEIITQRAAIRPYCTRPNLISIHGVYGSNSRSERVWLSLSLSQRLSRCEECHGFDREHCLSPEGRNVS